MPRHSSDPFHQPHKAGSRGCIGEYRVLGSGLKVSRLASTLGRTDEALELLRTVGDEVADVMRGRGWWTPLLTEFSGFTKQAGNQELLGMNRNRGQVIYLRLRYPSSASKTLTDTFLPMEEILGTMLHELAHNVRGPHDEIFQRTLAELEEEYFESKRKRSGFGGTDYRTGGSSGGSVVPTTAMVKPFQGAGVKLGSAPATATPLRTIGASSLQRQAAQAAEQRRNANPSKLSSANSAGAALTGGKTLAQLAAEAAARRKAQTERGCASGRTEKEQESAVKWHEEEEMLHGVKVITIQDDSDEEEEGNPRAGSAPQKTSSANAKAEKRPTRQPAGQKRTRTTTANATAKDPDRRTDVVVLDDESVVVIDDSSEEEQQVT